MDGQASLSRRGHRFKLRGLKKVHGTLRTNDDVHSSIALCPLIIAILDTPQMQRLRSLKQLGVSEMTYVCTTHSRFEHSLGVAHLAEVLLRGIKQKQKKLGITEKDIICVKIAGLLHDIGHGPFSHVYDGNFRKQLGKAMERGKWLGQEFDASLYDGLPEVMEDWAHEDASLMMIDALLRFLGLEIDEMNLDEPLKQIGDGIDARCFGIHSDDGFADEVDGREYEYDESSNISRRGQGPSVFLDHDHVLTSRDWIFIKECIVGGPLPPKGMSIEKAKKTRANMRVLGRPNRSKEFLYDVVSNRHSGMDVDKMDYLLRDGRRALGVSGKTDMDMILENSCVAWAKCGNPANCWECRQKQGHVKLSSNTRDDWHLMIVYPDKDDRMVDNVMKFFESRYHKHQTIYTHATTNAACYQICDILILADPYLRITARNASNETALKLPISRAMVSADTYLQLKDSILDVIAFTSEEKLEPARELVRRFQARDLYKMVAQETIKSSNGKGINLAWHNELWEMTESEIASEIVKCSKLAPNLGISLTEDDVIVEKRSIHHGMKEENPVNNIRFLSKNLLSKLRNAPEDLPEAEQYAESETAPKSFLRRTVRVYCRNRDGAVQDHLITCYHQLIFKLQKRLGADAKMKKPDDDEEVIEFAQLSQSPFQGSDDDDSENVDEDSGGDNDDDERRKKRKRGNNTTFFQAAVACAKGGKLDFHDSD